MTDFPDPKTPTSIQTLLSKRLNGPLDIAIVKDEVSQYDMYVGLLSPSWGPSNDGG